jgi:hypothetical protein
MGKYLERCFMHGNARLWFTALVASAGPFAVRSENGAANSTSLSGKLFLEAPVCFSAGAFSSALALVLFLGVFRFEHLAANDTLKPPEMEGIFGHKHFPTKE